jgi:hypothetical protein
VRRRSPPVPSALAPLAALAALALLVVARGAAAQSICAAGEPVGQLVSMVRDVRVTACRPGASCRSCPYVPTT